MDYFRDTRVAVTGSCGTVGSELVRLLLDEYAVRDLVAIDNAESELFFQAQRFEKHSQAQFLLADIRDPRTLRGTFQDVDIVFHAAGLKHVLLCEGSPFEAVQTNVLGVKNVIHAAAENTVGRVIFTSSDKAVNPTNVMGTTKLLGERLMTAANATFRRTGTVFASTRFGNVLGSRGSVIPVFREQIRRGGPVTLTDPRMTRFIMSITQAVRLVIDSAAIARGGEVLVTKMPAIKIGDLAELMIETLAPSFGFAPDEIEIRTIGAKSGEKLYEELLTREETERTVELANYFVVLPALADRPGDISNYEGFVTDRVQIPYNSAETEALGRSELRDFLVQNRLLEEDDEHHPAERFWPTTDE